MEICSGDKEHPFWSYPYTLMCVSTQYFPELWEIITGTLLGLDLLLTKCVFCVLMGAFV